MVDVHAKDDTYRVAKACGTIKVNDAVYRAVSTGTAKKGQVLGVATIAGIMGQVTNFYAIPLCHPICRPQSVMLSLSWMKNSSLSRQFYYSLWCGAKPGVEMLLIQKGLLPLAPAN